MSLFPNSYLGIWLDTPVKFLENIPAKRLRDAANEAMWSKAANDSELPWDKKATLSQLCCKDRTLGGYLTAKITHTGGEDVGTGASRSLYRHRGIAHQLSKQLRVMKLANWFWPEDNKKKIMQPHR